MSDYRILVVDDNAESAQMTAWAMEMFGHSVHIAHNGTQALEIASKIIPQVVIMDIGLPDINGYEVCTLMRQKPELQSAVILAQTGWDRPEDRVRSRQVGFDFHLVKPVELTVLQEIIDKLPQKLAA